MIKDERTKFANEIGGWSEFNIDNMEEYDITKKLREILNKYDFFNKS